jgi:hypothetical protein
MKPHPLLGLLALTLIFAGLNCLKPLHMDDGTYYWYAAHIAGHPFDPYGFEMDTNISANHILAPPVVLYWWALGLRLVGSNPHLWKLWMLPFGLMLAGALYALGRRFARGLEMPLVWMAVLSPAVLPAWNLMLDVPALALSLFALTLFFRACDRRSTGLATLAGLVVGLAMQTKYTAFIAPAAMLVYGILFRRKSLAVLAAALGVAVFCTWEWFLISRYGESHFLYSLHQRDRVFWLRVVRSMLPLATILGGVTPVLALLGLVALEVSRCALRIAGVVVCLGYVLIAIVPDEYATWVRDPQTGQGRFILNHLIFGGFGLAAGGIGLAVVRRLLVGGISNPSGPQDGLEIPPTNPRIEWFLVTWLALEVAGYFVLSPFPAVRRVMGIVTVGTLLIGRLASQTCRSQPRAGLVRGTVLGGILLGGGFFAIDLREAVAAKQAAEDAAQYLHTLDPQATIWSYGLWGFQYYTEQAAIHTVKLNPRPGDWLIAGDPRYSPWPGPLHRLEVVAERQVTDRLPLRTVACYYGGRTALEHHEGPRYTCIIYRVRY